MYVIQGASSDRFSDSRFLETILHQRNNTRAPRNNVVRLTNTSEISLKLRSSCTLARSKFEVSIDDENDDVYSVKKFTELSIICFVKNMIIGRRWKMYKMMSLIYYILMCLILFYKKKKFGVMKTGSIENTRILRKNILQESLQKHVWFYFMCPIEISLVSLIYPYC